MKETVAKLSYKIAALAISLIFLIIIYQIYSMGSINLDFIDRGIILVALFVIAFVIESRYIPIVGVLPNVLLLYALLESIHEQIPLLLDVYLFSGILLGLLAYLLFSLSKVQGRLHKTVTVIYSLKTIFPIYLSYYLLGSFTHPFITYSFFLFAVITWAVYAIVGT